MQQFNTATTKIDEVSPLEMVSLFNKEDKKVALAVEGCGQSVAMAVEAATEALQGGGRLVYIGSGTPGKMGVIDASECPPTFGVNDNTVIGIISGGTDAVVGWCEDTEDDEHLAIIDLEVKKFSAKDILVCVSASGNTPYVLAAADYARKLGAKTVGLCCSTGGKLEKVVDISIIVDVGPEVIMGSTRLKAGTAQKMVLNIISSCAMIQLGKTYGNLMVDVLPLNDKLKRRVVEIVQIACDCDEATARKALAKANNNAKTAIVMLLKGLEAEAAQQCLAQHGGYVKKALKD